MAIAINGSGTITGVSVGGLPDGIVDTDMIATSAVSVAKLSTGKPEWTSSGDLQFNSGYGSVATAFGVRAWITFNGAASTIGTGRENGNMDAVTDNGAGDYTLNFTNDMPDANYCVVATLANTYNDYSNIVSDQTRAVGTVVVHGTTAPTTGAVRLMESFGSSANNNGGAGEFETFVAIIR